MRVWNWPMSYNSVCWALMTRPKQTLKRLQENDVEN